MISVKPVFLITLFCLVNYYFAEEYLIATNGNRKIKVIVHPPQNKSVKKITTNIAEPSESGKKYLDDYKGEHFPTEYLFPDDVTPTMGDVELYLETLARLTGYYTSMPNKTDDINQAIGLYYTKALLKRSIEDYDQKIGRDLKKRMKEIIRISEHILSHYIHSVEPFGWGDYEFRVSKLLKDDEAQVYSIEKFNRHRLQRWLRSKTDFNTFSRDFDTLAFPKEKYVELVAYREKYYINISDSNVCLSNAIYSPVPIDLKQLQRCKINRKCDRVIHSTPTVGYSLSHRMLNILFPRSVRRCYIRSPEEDMANMEKMCAFMYREAVYLARRGFFARDLFLEHVALCSLLGYEEFHRRNWYHKASRWVDDEGCLAESHNFRFNYTNIVVNNLNGNKDRKAIRLIKKRGRQNLLEYCEIHPMAMLQIVLAHGIRHAFHYLPVN